MANQKERFQPASGAIAFVFMLFSQALEDRHFTKHESVPQNVAGIIKAQRLIEIAGNQIDFAQREIFFRTVERTQENLDRRVQTRGFYSSKRLPAEIAVTDGTTSASVDDFICL